MTRHLPPNVRIKHGSYHLVSDGRWKKLSRVSEGESALYAALSRQSDPKHGSTINDLLDAYCADGMSDLRPKSQSGYLQQIRSALRPVFGTMPVSALTTAQVAQYLERAKRAGKRRSGNIQMAILSSAYEFGLRNGLCESNPCRGVRRNKVSPRKRYVRDEEYLSLFNSCSEPLQDFLALAYLTGFRSKDLRSLRRSSITPDGIRIEESKTGKLRIVAWSEAVRYFVIRAQTRAPQSPFVLTNSHGDPWTEFGLASAMRRARPAGGEHFTIHDIRAKAESDHKDGLGLMALYKRARRDRPVR